jgi:regulator of sigma E protease
MLSIIAPIVVFGLVIFVHELGHFIAAKATGVYAPRFSIGFGHALLSKRIGETEYRLAAIPLGGYVRMASRDDEASAFIEGGSEEGAAGTAVAPVYEDPNAMKPFGPKDVPADRWFESKSLPARLFIMLAGVTMNALLAFVLCVSVLAYYGRPIPVPAIDQVLPGKPAQLAGLRAGDSLIAVNGRRITRWEDFQHRVQTSIGVPVTLTIVRDGRTSDVSVVPADTVQPDSLTGKPEHVGKIGVAPKSLRGSIPFTEAISGGFGMTVDMGGLVFHTLRNIHPSELMGPIGIVQASVQVAHSGVIALMLLIATISINVAIVNLLPIPVLDGGQIVLQVLETIRGSPFSLKTRENILRGGLLIIGALLVLVMFNDISRNLEPITHFFARVFGRGV